MNRIHILFKPEPECSRYKKKQTLQNDEIQIGNMHCTFPPLMCVLYLHSQYVLVIDVKFFTQTFARLCAALQQIL